MQTMCAALVPSEGSSRASKPSQELPTLFLPELLFTPFIFQEHLQYLGTMRCWTRKPRTIPTPATDSKLLQNWVVLVKKSE